MKKEDRKTKLERLLERNRLRQEEEHRNLLFEECLDALGSGAAVLGDTESQELERSFTEEFIITSYGRIEWDLYKGYEQLDRNALASRYAHEQEVYHLVWSHGSQPVIEARMNRIVERLDDVTAVSPDVWIYQKNKRVIELFHDGVIRVYDKTTEM
ncbi:hypothetical protein [Saccharibacillus brassicae]|uniref:Uncharacterized protein n=1 Tax=Saccharibacillus brassicae TaxID=2583377 RepID=A0A4Y6UZ87_SACBS|nr:hypothetical protein [Saccharibacillus brassicae]QDH23069.1 hypothetical protein FFV09_20755 [Saccharibacillus brassicae]